MIPKLPILDIMDLINERFKQLNRQINDGLKAYKKRNEKIRKSNERWILAGKVPMNLITLYDHRRNKFKKFITRKKGIPEVLKILESNKFIKPFLKIIKSALIGHCKKDYYVSIPLLLLSIDGAFIRYGKENGIVVGGKIKSKKSVKKIRERYANMDSVLEEIYYLFDKPFCDFMTKTIKNKAWKYKGLWQFRNDVMHGIQPNYNDEQWSLRLIYVLTILRYTLK